MRIGHVVLILAVIVGGFLVVKNWGTIKGIVSK